MHPMNAARCVPTPFKKLADDTDTPMTGYVSDTVAQYSAGDNVDYLIEQARNNMECAAKSLDFMAAARYRDRMYELQQIKEEQLKNQY